METMMALFYGEFWRHLVLALLHTIWIGALTSGVLLILLRRIPTRRANLRYLAALGALATVVMGGLLALAILEAIPRRPAAAIPSASGAPARRLASVPAPGNVSQATLPAASTTPARTAESSETPAMPAAPPPGRFAGPLDRWTPWLAWGWLLGTALMLARMARAVAVAERAGRACRPLTDPAILAIFDEIKARLGISRRVEALVGEGPGFPCVTGLLRPVVLLPASLFTGVPPEHLRAILAHELAHIRRHDMLANLAQMFVEALLFFNPFVWWIGRQIRHEREACCDAMAATATGRALDLAHALAVLSAYRVEPAPLAAAAFSDSPRPAGALDRIRRLVQPGYRPALRLPWPSFLVYLCLSFLALACIKKASDGAVALAASILSHQERIEKMEAIQQSYGNPESDLDEGSGSNKANSKAKVGVSIHVRTWDGRPVPRDLRVQGIFLEKKYTEFLYLSSQRSDFTSQLTPGTYSLAASATGYAPALAGPLRVKPGHNGQEITLVLQKGFPGRVRVMAPDGKPLAGTRLKGTYAEPSQNIGLSATTDRDGLAVFDNVSTAPMRLTATAADYAEEGRKDLRFDPQKIYEWKMTPTPPASGQVIDAATGRPVAGAEVRLIISRTMNMSYSSTPQQAQAETRTDAQGRFTLTTLRADSDYYYLVVAPGYRQEPLNDVTAGQRDLCVRMKPALVVRGKVTGLSRLPAAKRKNPTITARQTFLAKPRDSQGMSVGTGGFEEIKLNVEGDAGSFEIVNLFEGKLELEIGEARLKLDVSKSIDNVLIDLAQPQGAQATRNAMSTRTVVLRLITPPGMPAIKGHLKAEYTTTTAQGDRMVQRDVVEIIDGTARLVVQTPNQLEVQPSPTAGYWFKPLMSIKVDQGREPFETALPAMPAGAIYGRVLEEDGQPARQIMVSVNEIEKAPAKEYGGGLGVDVKNSTNGEWDTANKFNAAPLPLGGTYMIVAHRGETYQVSPPIRLDEKTPLKELTLTMPKGITLTGRVTGPAGQPIPRIRIGFNYQATPSNGYGNENIQTDANGEFKIDRVNPQAPGQYAITVFSRRDWQPARLEIKPGPAPIEIQLKPGRVVTGRVIDDETGQPVPKADLYLMAVPGEGQTGVSMQGRWPLWLDPEADSDAQGNFRFSNVGDGTYELNCRTGQVVRKVIVKDGSPIRVELRVKLSEWKKQELAKNRQ